MYLNTLLLDLFTEISVTFDICLVYEFYLFSLSLYDVLKTIGYADKVQEIIYTLYIYI